MQLKANLTAYLLFTYRPNLTEDQNLNIFVCYFCLMGDFER